MKSIREIIHEEIVEGCAIRVWTIHGTGVFQPEWHLRGRWYLGYGAPSLKAAAGEARQRISFERQLMTAAGPAQRVE
jgi:hypothetical protein